MKPFTRPVTPFLIFLAFTAVLLFAAATPDAPACKCYGNMDWNPVQGYHNFHCPNQNQACDNNQGVCAKWTDANGTEHCRCKAADGTMNVDQLCKCYMFKRTSVPGPECSETLGCGVDPQGIPIECERVTSVYLNLSWCACP